MYICFECFYFGTLGLGGHVQVVSCRPLQSDLSSIANAGERYECRLLPFYGVSK